MDFRIQDVSKSFVTETVFSTLYCCLITSQISDVLNNGESSLPVWILLAVGGLMFVGWLIWVFRKYVSGLRIIPMPKAPGKLSGWINIVLFIFWVLTDIFKVLCHPYVAIIAWVLMAVSTGYYIYYVNKYGYTD